MQQKNMNLLYYKHTLKWRTIKGQYLYYHGIPQKQKKNYILLGAETSLFILSFCVIDFSSCMFFKGFIVIFTLLPLLCFCLQS